MPMDRTDMAEMALIGRHGRCDPLAVTRLYSEERGGVIVSSVLLMYATGEGGPSWTYETRVFGGVYDGLSHRERATTDRREVIARVYAIHARYAEAIVGFRRRPVAGATRTPEDEGRSRAKREAALEELARLTQELGEDE